ncbi:MAG: hypothetical protein PHD33_07580 [Atribacterota bacterium]|nr:hypothetical protein [Atribacterota bacterium]
MSDISKEILEKIKKEKVSPKPKWYFLTRNYFFWTMFIINTILGGIAFGMILLTITKLDWDIFNYLGMGLPKALITSIPYLWVVILLFFVFVTYHNFVHTRTGYRYRIILIFVISLSISIFLGLIFYQYGLTEVVEKHIRNRIPGYHRLVYTGEKQWMHPEKGLITGIIGKIDVQNKSILLKDYFNQEWDVDYSEAKIRGSILLAEGLNIKIIGNKTSEEKFSATEIRIGRGFQQGRNR